MKQQVLTQIDFDSLLNWLDPNREKAGEKYEMIRGGLIDIFHYRGCTGPEELADITINRVAKKVHEIRSDYTGNPARYFYGVAKKVYLEYLKQRQPLELMALTAARADDVEYQYACLDKCMEKLTPDNRDMILQYYSEKKQAKIDSRKALRDSLHLKASALRVRIHRIRENLEKCVCQCVETYEQNVMN